VSVDNGLLDGGAPPPVALDCLWNCRVGDDG